MTATPKNFIFLTALSANVDFLADWEQFTKLNPSAKTEKPFIIEQYVNGKNLSCPMPLLKLKMALKSTMVGNSVYLTATDPNSIHDIGAFCRHMAYDFFSLQSDDVPIIFHLVVQKTQ